MKIYVAGASSEVILIEELMACLREGGIEITCDWTENIRFAQNQEVDLSYKRACAEADLRGIREAAVFWMVLPKAESIGCYVELGYAIGIRRCIVVSGLVTPNNIFCMLESDILFKKFAIHSSALTYLIELHQSLLGESHGSV